MTFAALLIALATTLPTGLPAGSGDPIMLDFTATWCGPCQSVRPAVEQLVQNGYPIKAIDLDTNQSLAERYDVHEVPTFLVIEPGTGRELGRIKGAQPASALANFYNQAAAKARPSANRAQPKENTEDEANEAAETEETPAAAPAPSNPKPWETVVRIKVHGNGAIGFGSGTIIASTPEESLILTCAHIFKIEHAQTPPPRAFPRKITIDLFDGNLSGPKRNQVHYTNETLEGEAVDYDFNLDVGLIRIRPGRRLAYSKVVPAHWKPKTRMGMITVGCSEGHDATAWNTIVANPAMKGLNGNRLYEAIECMNAPKQGRSGGGLFTEDGYVAGVCDFAEPQGNHGLYAAPNSIYKILDRNELTALYTPTRDRPKTLLARNRAPQRGALGNSGNQEFRLQSPDRPESGNVTLPAPEMFGITTPVVAHNEPAAATPSRTNYRSRDTWHPTTTSPARSANLLMDPSTDPDRFGTASEPVTVPDPTQVAPESEPEAAPTRVAPRSSSGRWKAGKTPLPELSSASLR